jgi:hypothetical protein
MIRYAIVLAALLLSACETVPARFTPPAFAFEQSQSQPIRLQVGSIEFINHYQPPLRDPQVEHLFLVTPSAAIERWVSSRMVASGGAGVLQITLHEASVTSHALPTTTGVKGLFTDDQDTRYDGKIAVTFRLFDGTSNASRAAGDVEVTRFISLNERATIDMRERRFHQMLDTMMTDFNREAEQRLRQHFGLYFR